MTSKPRLSAFSSLTSLLLLGFVLGACGSDQPDTSRPAESGARAPAPEAPPPIELEPERFQIREASGEVFGFVHFGTDVIRLVKNEGEERRLWQARVVDGEHRYNERGIGPAALVEVNLKSFAEHVVLREPSGEFRYRAELRADRALAYDRDPGQHEEVAPLIIRRAQDNFLRINRAGENLGSVLINDKGQVRVRNGAGELVYKINGVETFTTGFGLLLLPEADPMDRLLLMAELHLLERKVSAGAG